MSTMSARDFIGYAVLSLIVLVPLGLWGHQKWKDRRAISSIECVLDRANPEGMGEENETEARRYYESSRKELGTVYRLLSIRFGSVRTRLDFDRDIWLPCVN
ncbi:MAG: hypothetical protein KatS3mg051_1589 [Anaerolineae bacterium]|nr:MAG: hypothetical protein KatS3mg051_1589 [Anaerolineae bacterium]